MLKYVITYVIFLICSISSSLAQDLKTELELPSGSKIELNSLFLKDYTPYALKMDTPWFANNSIFEGYHFKEILKSFNISESKTLTVIAYNDYSVDIPVKDVYEYDMILANRHNGVKMTLRAKGPFILLYPFNIRKELTTAAYYAKCPWQIKKIVIK